MAVEQCCERQLSWLIYGKYLYGVEEDSPLTEFKRRNGFEELRVPRYYFAVTLLGRCALALGLHRGLRESLPECIVRPVLTARAWLYRRRAAAPSGLQSEAPPVAEQCPTARASQHG
jgi:hypothetical protein